MNNPVVCTFIYFMAPWWSEKFWVLIPWIIFFLPSFYDRLEQSTPNETVRKRWFYVHSVIFGVFNIFIMMLALSDWMFIRIYFWIFWSIIFGVHSLQTKDTVTIHFLLYLTVFLSYILTLWVSISVGFRTDYVYWYFIPIGIWGIFLSIQFSSPSSGGAGLNLFIFNSNDKKIDK